MARIHPPLENWRRVSGEIRTEPLISSGNIRRLQREERPRGDPAGRSPRRLPSRPRKAKYISGAVYQHTLRHTDLALRKPKKKRTKIECSKYWCHYGTEKSLTQTNESLGCSIFRLSVIMSKIILAPLRLFFVVNRFKNQTRKENGTCGKRLKRSLPKAMSSILLLGSSSAPPLAISSLRWSITY